MPPAGLLVIGDVVTDVVAIHREGIAKGTDTAADITLRPGGSGANTAAWAARLGADARLLARAGFDTAEWHTAALVRAGVLPHVRVDAGRPTAVVIAMVDGTGERTMLTNRGAGGAIGPGDWADELLDGVGHLHVSGYTLFAGPGLLLARRAMAAAAGRGARISVDPASTGFLHDFGVERFLAETAPAGLVIPNLDEALLLTGETDAERAAELLSARYGTAVVKLGADGALLARRGRVSARAPGARVDVVDSTGAGDAFAAGYLTASLGGANDADALAAGCRSGADATTLVGGRPDLRLSPDLSPDELYPIDTN
ncbi:PfkB family carbohydrate kinase [Microtetraspora sp. NBRC 13810]|uniref:carbohydrate kinase family protein n=1 Tax=Microtetraspora sp. NBRC 13810 TaxID=3030990 RepID=UPI002553F2D2|nr:PfkB family carbohydrate kinase [Microtetraspora sp. NBRC 13810]